MSTKQKVREEFKTFLYLNFQGDKNQGIVLTLILKRRIMNELLTTYLPTCFILSIVYATTFFKPFFFEAVVMVNLTAFLVLTTLFISVSESLPPTAYVKMIDVWLIFSQLIPFVEVLLHTLIETMRDADERLINNHGEFRTVQKVKINTITPEDENVLITKQRAKLLLNLGESAGGKANFV